ncbi:uncharacterized protein LOC111627198 [Centruroides sculpturatus]|uniref:uncharacterized protein LOC111627198 n=1 Tax=Centruroides sculpturatus TaxID=218467 RepID=UPI000C6CCE1A|nr:uncharacterized protein LOC111627198 [Centruroides sculpturatus]
MPEFTKQFNDATRARGDEPVPVEITVYHDKSFDFKLFTAPASYKIMQSAKIEKGSPNSKTQKVGTISKEQLRQIAEYKLPDLNTNDLEAAMRIIAGTARNMGILIQGVDNIEAELEAAKEAAKEAEIAAKKEAQLEEDLQQAAQAKDAPIEVSTIKQDKETDEQSAESEEKK